MGYRPGRWLFGLLPLALVGLAAHQINTQRMETSLARDAESATARLGAALATVGMDGRDATIEGEAPDAGALKAVSDAVAGLYGVRRVDAGAATVAATPAVPADAPDAAPPAMPVLSATSGYPPVLSGTFDAADTATLSVTVAGREFRLGTDPELATAGDTWTLSLKEPLTDGTYDVTVAAIDKAGNRAALDKPGGLVVDVPAPPEPTVDTRVGNDPLAPVTGTWTPGPGRTLEVRAGGHSYVLGRDAALSSDAAGRWSLVPQGGLPDGTADVVATVTGAGGKTITDATANEVIVDTAPPVPPSAIGLKPWTGAPAPIVITGRYPADDAATLAATIAGKTFSLGEADSPLAAAGADTFALTLRDPLPDGTYTATVTVTDRAGNVARTSAELTIAPAMSEPPRVSVVSGSRPDVTIAGTVDRATRELAVTVDGTTHRLGEPNGPVLDPATGNWTLSLAAPLAAGSYDVVVEARDSAGTVARAATPLVVTAIDVAPPPPPAITGVTSGPADLTVTGTWAPAETDRLTVTVGESVFTSGQSPELQALDNGAWTLTLPRPASDGTYAVTASAIDRAGNTAAAAAPEPIVVDTKSPPLPTVAPLATIVGRPVIQGTWPDDDAARFTVTVDDQVYVMGETPALQRTAPGRWALTPALDLAPGSHEVIAKATDAAGNVSTDVTRFELFVKAAPQVAEAPACEEQFAGLLAREQIRFATDSVAIEPGSDSLLEKLAEAAKGCAGIAIEVAGHTDDTGSSLYNQALSEGRAAQVVKRLVKLGVEPDRLTAVGYGESRPIAANGTAKGRAQNRRIEFKAKP